MRSIVLVVVLILNLLTASLAYAEVTGESNSPKVTTAAPYTEFFGEDLNGSEDDRLSSRPNADSAHAQFLANLSLHGTEDFESITANSTPPFTMSFGFGGATLTGSGMVINQPMGTDGSGRYPISGNQYLNSSESFTIMMQSPVRAIGFYCVDAGDGGANPTLSLAVMGGGTINVTVPNSIKPQSSSQGAVLFYGIVTTLPFTQATVSSTHPTQDFFGFDDVTVGDNAAIPTVSGWGLLSFGMLSALAGGLVLARNRNLLRSTNR